METKADFLFEVSWEICNKVGGIYTVVKSKAAQMEKYYGKNYFLVGPYFANKFVGEFQEEVPIDCFKEAFEELKKQGIICHFGKWQIEGQPNVILIDFEGYKNKANDIKKELWEKFKIDSMRAGNDYTEPVTWSYASGIVIEKLASYLNDKKVAAHFHEWLSGTGLLYLKSKKCNVGTVFTTHATILGRTLATAGVDIYSLWDKIEPEKEIYNHFIESKFMIEKQSAINADTFTTVSEITAMEAEHFLGRKADVLVLNGLDIEKFPTFEELVIKHRLQRDRLREFCTSYFFPYYEFDMRKTLFYFIASRYEFHDKGINTFINALSDLNKRLKEENSEKTVVAFFWVPTDIRHIKAEIIENKTYYQDIKDSLEENMVEVRDALLNSIITNQNISKNKIFEKNFLMEIKSKVKRFKKQGNPPMATHDLHYDNDDILTGFHDAGLDNSEECRVKVVFYPIYLNGADGLANLNYYEAITATHLGVFPSYYEPWGYTPLESGALGVASVTTDLAGFGRFIKEKTEMDALPGVYVIDRLGKSDDDATQQLADVLHKFTNLSKHNRVLDKMQARKAASLADWNELVKNYIDAHNHAVENKN